MHDALAAALRPVLGIVTVEALERLTGGASRETWRFDAVADDGTRHELVLRRDPPGRPSEPGAMSFEAAAARACAEDGLLVPEVLVSSEIPSPWETAGMVVRRVDGETLARRILRDDDYALARPALVGACGTFLAGLHRIDPERVPGLHSRDPVENARANQEVAGQRSPTLELGYRWLAAHRPPPRPHVVLHGDFRLGNLIVGPEGLRAVLDWELAHLGDPVEDLGWLCTKAWRFGAELPVGGFATRQELLDAYAAAGGDRIELDELRWWEVLNTLKWGVGCMGQAATHLRGAVRSVELAAIGRRICEQEWDLLLLVCPEACAAAASDVSAELATSPAGGDLHGRPTQLELLDAVEGFLRDEVLPGTEGRLSFLARVAANVVATTARETALGPAQAARRQAELGAVGLGSEEELTEAIAAGSFDGRDAELHALLTSGVAAKLAVANPRYLTAPSG